MGELTKIEWTTHTFNPWRGCEKISAGCANCYAERQAKQNPAVLGHWGPAGPRAMASEDYWADPRRWDRQAHMAGVRRRVFCGSLMDVFELGERLPAENQADMAAARLRLWRLIDETPSLDWMLLTKRPENGFGLLPQRWAGRWPTNLWLGVSVEDQAAVDARIPHLLRSPAPVRFLSVEPLLGPVDLTNGLICGPVATSYVCRCGGAGGIDGFDAQSGSPIVRCSLCNDSWVLHARRLPRIDWVIVGGESGPRARPCSIEWIRRIVSQCRDAEVACFVKQLGALPVIDYYSDDDDLREQCLADNGRVWEPTRGGRSPWDWRRDRYQPKPGTILEMTLREPKGGDPGEWPEDLRVREIFLDDGKEPC